MRRSEIWFENPPRSDPYFTRHLEPLWRFSFFIELLIIGGSLETSSLHVFPFERGNIFTSNELATTFRKARFYIFSPWNFETFKVNFRNKFRFSESLFEKLAPTFRVK